MAHYIDKDPLVAEIKRRMDENGGKQSLPQYFGMVEEDLNILYFIDTLEVKDVDLEEEIQNVIHNHFFDLNGIAIAGTSSYATVEDMVYIAKHFFELGLKVKQG